MTDKSQDTKQQAAAKGDGQANNNSLENMVDQLTSQQAGGGQNSQGNGQQQSGQAGGQQQDAQGAPLSQQQQQQDQKLEGQIQAIEQQLQGLSNSELKTISSKLEAVERSMLIKKIDNELHTMKDTLVKPGEGGSTAAAGSAAAGAAVIQQPTNTE